MGTQELIACFQDTLAASRQEILAAETERAAASSVIFREGYASPRLFTVGEAEIEVIAGTTFDTAKKYLQFGKTAVLNFANPHYPGGGVRNGAMGQEECLCRSSNLYDCLADDRLQEEYYRYHREQTDYFFSDRLIYTKGVTVFKDDRTVPALMPREQWFQVDVITCAAPYIAKRKYTNHTVLKEMFKSRIRNILEAAIENGAQVLILGAFGCGAFKNPPEVVAGAFWQVLQDIRYRSAFRRIVFAIKPTMPNGKCPNLAAFRKEFCEAEAEPAETEEDILLPGGRILRGGESRKYQEWKRQNPYFRKQFSVMGDSISTLDGFNPRGYSQFYTGTMREKTGVREMRDTWWGKVIGFFGGELLVNNAWSGSMVARHPSQKDAFPSGCSPRRTGELHIGSVKPDVILVYIGINDWANGIKPSDPSGGDSVFAFAYGMMLADMKRNYPDAEIWCCTLNRTYMASNPGFVFPADYGGIHLSMYNRMIAEAAGRYQCRLLDLDGMGLPYDSVDGTHPTAHGMDVLAALVIRSAAGETGGVFLDCEAGRHDNMEIPFGDGAYRYVCKRCGHRYVLSSRDRKREVNIDPAARRREECVLQLYQKETGKTLRFRGEQIFAGRSKDCHLQLHSGYAARYQAEFIFRDGAWYLRDNNSKNGTYLNGTRLEPGMEMALKANDVIGFARMEEVVFRPVGMV